MRQKKYFISSALLVLSTLLFTSCLNTTNDHLSGMENNTERLAKEVEADREYIKALLEEMRLVRESMTSEMKRMADTLVTLQVTSVEVFKLFMEQIFKASPAAKTPDLKDIMADPSFEIPSPSSEEKGVTQ
jgi:Fe2+ transport system protein B